MQDLADVDRLGSAEVVDKKVSEKSNCGGEDDLIQLADKVAETAANVAESISEGINSVDSAEVKDSPESEEIGTIQVNWRSLQLTKSTLK